MTLHIYDQLEQGTDEWLAARRGMVTASVVGKLITPSTIKPASNPESRGLALLLASERITGLVEPTYMNDDMLRGHEAEPIARNIYCGHFEQATEVGFMVREFDGFRLGFSPDGLVGDHGLIEVKAPRAKGHVATILAGEVPAHHIAQCQAGLLVSGREWLDFISFHAGEPMFVKRVLPDPKWFKAITDAVAATETAIEQMVADYGKRTKRMPKTERVDCEIKVA